MSDGRIKDRSVAQIILALVRMHLLRWTRSRAPFGVAAFVAVLCWYDSTSGGMGANAAWWGTPVFVAAWAGFLVGYDTFERLRAEGSLRLILLHPVPRSVVGGASLLAGALISFAATVAALAYILIAGRTSSVPEVAFVVPLLLLGTTAFVAYAQALSTILPRDTAAVLGVIALAFGSGTPGRWIPDSAPGSVKELVRVVWSAMPTSVRLSEMVSRESVLPNALLFSMYVIVGMALTTVQLRRARNLARRGDS